MIMQILFGYILIGVLVTIYASHDNRFFKAMFPKVLDYLKLVILWPHTIYVIIKTWGKE